ncbi:MAG: MarR family transcriptional regulator [Planctomycetes bacterium]|nr:MarR family transcriptional regulator [Planctomycetota bacterium]
MPTHYRGTAGERRALNAYIALLRAAESVTSRLAGPLGREGLTTGQFGVLEALLHLGPMCQKTLGRKLLRSGGNITLVVDHLEHRGLVSRRRAGADRRFVTVELTEAGKTVIRQTFPSHAKRIVGEMKPLAPGEQESLRRLCRRLGRGGGA